ncbi:MAG TPA: hypothetical protein VFY34_02380 [Pyrinomonadaceae bacterium]|nr:hypothetical protein [Pyrinomonadaceae bacterium]
MTRLIIFICLPVLLAPFCSHRTAPLQTLPPVILWAWERPEDLSFIDPHTTGVAYLAKTIDLRGDLMTVRPRLQPLQLAPGTRVIAVVRIDTDAKQSWSGPDRVKKIGKEIADLADRADVVQIDYDALVHERKLYREILQEVRRQLPADSALSMTALASWCAGDDWLGDLPVDEAVPMLFRLGVDGRQFQWRLETGRAFESRMCQNAAGVSTDEPVKAPAVDRLYIFNPKPWTKDSFTAAMETYRK